MIRPPVRLELRTCTESLYRNQVFSVWIFRRDAIADLGGFPASGFREVLHVQPSNGRTSFAAFRDIARARSQRSRARRLRPLGDRPGACFRNGSTVGGTTPLLCRAATFADWSASLPFSVSADRLPPRWSPLFHPRFASTFHPLGHGGSRTLEYYYILRGGIPARPHATSPPPARHARFDARKGTFCPRIRALPD